MNKKIETIMKEINKHSGTPGDFFVDVVSVDEVENILKKHLQEQTLTYEQGFERGKQVGYKEGWRAKGEKPTEDKLKTIEEVVSYIGQNEGREDSEDYYRKHFGLKLKYK